MDARMLPVGLEPSRDWSEIDFDGVAARLARFALPAFCVGVGLAFAALAQGYAFGTPARMGPGFFPTFVGLALAAQGLFLAAGQTGSNTEDDAEGAADRPVPPLQRLRGVAGIIGSFVIFGAATQQLGVLLGTVALVGVAAAARSGNRSIEVFATAAVLAAIASGLFVGLLGVPLPVLPR